MTTTELVIVVLLMLVSFVTGQVLLGIIFLFALATLLFTPPEV